MIQKIQLEMINYFERDVRRINHAVKVHSFAKLIAESEKISEKEKTIVEISSILHDIGIKISEKKYNSSAGHYQELEGPLVAKELLREYNLDENILQRVLYLIGNHHSYNQIDGIDFQILVEADFLVNVFEDEMNLEQIKSIIDKIFKTKTGIRLIEAIYV